MDNLHFGDRKVDRKGTRRLLRRRPRGAREQKQRKECVVKEKKLCVFITAGPSTKLLAGA